MTKVLHILNELRSSGAEVMIKNAAPYWQKKRVRLHVLSTGSTKGNYAETLAVAGYVVHHIPFANSLRFYFQIWQLMRTHHFDVVHIHPEHATLTYVVLARLAGIKVIVRTIHSNFQFNRVIKITRTIRRWAVYQLGVHQIAITDSVAKNEQSRFGNTTQVIYNWYDDSYFRPPTSAEKEQARQVLGFLENDNLILSIGNCAPVKNHTAIIQAIHSLKNKNYNILYGHIGEEDAEHNEQKLVQKLGLTQQVSFFGRQEDVRPYLWAADIFVMPSLYEGFSIAMLEALGCNLQLVLSRSPGLQEWEALFPEIIFTKTASQDLAMGLIDALNRNNKTIANSQAIRLRQFSTQQGAQSYYEIYTRKSLLKE